MSCTKLKITAILLGNLFVSGCSMMPSMDFIGRTEITQAAPTIATDRPMAASGYSPLFDQAIELMQQNKHQQAVTQWDQYLVSAPEDTLAGLNKAICLQALSRHKEASELLASLSDHPDAHKAVYLHLGLSYRNLGQFKQSETAYLQALKKAPDYALAHKNLGILYDLYLGQPANAMNHYQKAPDSKEVSLWISNLKQRSKHNQARATQ